MIVLGLDLATVTGWSRFRIQQHRAPVLLDAGLIDCRIKLDKDPPGKRFQHLWVGLDGLIESAYPSVIYYEAPVGGPFAGGPAMMVSIGMVAIVQQWSFANGAVCHPAAAGTVKKHATGNGQLTKTTKMEMVDAALRQFGKRYLPRRTPTDRQPWAYDDNVADAMWVGHYGACLEAHFSYDAPDRG
jgi:hypothetical protein